AVAALGFNRCQGLARPRDGPFVANGSEPAQAAAQVRGRLIEIATAPGEQTQVEPGPCRASFVRGALMNLARPAMVTHGGVEVAGVAGDVAEKGAGNRHSTQVTLAFAQPE